MKIHTPPLQGIAGPLCIGPIQFGHRWRAGRAVKRTAGETNCRQISAAAESSALLRLREDHPEVHRAGTIEHFWSSGVAFQLRCGEAALAWLDHGSRGEVVVIPKRAALRLRAGRWLLKCQYCHTVLLLLATAATAPTTGQRSSCRMIYPPGRSQASVRREDQRFLTRRSTSRHSRDHLCGGPNTRRSTARPPAICTITIPRLGSCDPSKERVPEAPSWLDTARI